MARMRRTGCPRDDCVAADPLQGHLSAAQLEKVGAPYKSRADALYICRYCDWVYERVAGEKEILGYFDRATGAWHPKKQHDD